MHENTWRVIKLQITTARYLRELSDSAHVFPLSAHVRSRFSRFHALQKTAESLGSLSEIFASTGGLLIVVGRVRVEISPKKRRKEIQLIR